MIRPHMFADIVRKPLYHVLLSTDTCPRTIMSPDKPLLFTILPSLAFSTRVVSFCIYLNAPLYASFTPRRVKLRRTNSMETHSNDNRLMDIAYKLNKNRSKTNPVNLQDTQKLDRSFERKFNTIRTRWKRIAIV